MPNARRSAHVWAGASFTDVREPDPETYAEKIDRLLGDGAPVSHHAVRALFAVDKSGVRLSPDDRLRMAGAIAREMEGEEARAERIEFTEQRAEAQERASSVYFIRHGQHIKIGVTLQGPDKRLSGMQLPPGAKLVAVIPNVPRVQEKNLHRQFAASRVKGEWFSSTPELEALISTFAV
jgi:hypothetical protein